MRTLILAVAGAVSLTSLAQNSPRLWTGDVPPAVHAKTSVVPIDLTDASDAYAIYKCVITNDIITRYLPYFVIDLDWGVDSTRRFIYAFIYCESKLDPYDANTGTSAQGILQMRQIAINQWAQLTKGESFQATELADRRKPPSATYLRSLAVLNAMAKADRWTTRELVWSKWLCGDDATCTNEANRLQYIKNMRDTELEMWNLEWDGIACSFRCNTEPFRTIEP